MYEDKKIVCKDCGAEFVFTAGEQEFYAQKGLLNDPVRCKACRDAKRQASRPAREPREMHTIICAKCGAEDQVNFLPTDGKPVYCKACYTEMKKDQQ